MFIRRVVLYMWGEGGVMPCLSRYHFNLIIIWLLSWLARARQHHTKCNLQHTHTHIVHLKSCHSHIIHVLNACSTLHKHEHMHIIIGKWWSKQMFDAITLLSMAAYTQFMPFLSIPPRMLLILVDSIDLYRRISWAVRFSHSQLNWIFESLYFSSICQPFRKRSQFANLATPLFLACIERASESYPHCCTV